MERGGLYFILQSASAALLPLSPGLSTVRLASEAFPHLKN